MSLFLNRCFVLGIVVFANGANGKEELQVSDGFQVVADRTALIEEAHEAAGEEMSAMQELKSAQQRLLHLGEKMSRRAAEDRSKGKLQQGDMELRAVREMRSLNDQINQHLSNVAQFSDMAEESARKQPVMSFLQRTEVHSHAEKAPEDDLAAEMTHDLEMNFNKIAPFGKEDTAKELQDHAAKTQDTLVDAVENAEVAEIKRAVFRALTRLRAATIKEFDTIARLETQAIDAYNDAHHYRAENPLAHLHEDEAPVETDKLKSFH
jgi:hypothetical protein|mmetsp:Transcript_48462/g.75505  ORF Transcript_48462/g.75505 Transcript_48462/m.75505 type:complete len:265 (+) Transcript_48462:62-856(+)|eukprot:CAMPEP_0169131164 /NCGR_PEP_ID=MMETSP1015-20121227/38103_1 /TAXON_ID=342587 /ORGANISM="Karlodinium micrum, Strain CCMP2283" /LENGTH=264 /DNA_ID=CAMNT_0009195411 /DNA_START=74 /DNA_END=868 /DNA_ORIENTATION=+